MLLRTNQINIFIGNYINLQFVKLIMVGSIIMGSIFQFLTTCMNGFVVSENGNEKNENAKMKKINIFYI
jgi:hypothetical protein